MRWLNALTKLGHPGEAVWAIALEEYNIALAQGSCPCVLFLAASFDEDEAGLCDRKLRLASLQLHKQLLPLPMLLDTGHLERNSLAYSASINNHASFKYVCSTKIETATSAAWRFGCGEWDGWLGW